MLLALCEENSLVTGGFLSQRARNVENISMEWHNHVDGLAGAGSILSKKLMVLHKPTKKYSAHM